MTSTAGSRLVKLMIIEMGVLLVLVGLTFAQSYIGRHRLADSEKQARSAMIDQQRAYCELEQLDQADNAQGWRTSETASLAALAEKLNISLISARAQMTQRPRVSDSFELVAARQYDKIAADLENRSEIVCTEIFPKESG